MAFFQHKADNSLTRNEPVTVVRSWKVQYILLQSSVTVWSIASIIHYIYRYEKRPVLR